MRTLARIVVPLLVALACAVQAQVTVTLDPSKTHQTIEGFGAYGARDTWFRGTAGYDAAFVDRIVNELGVSVLRTEVLDLEPENDNDDPARTDWRKFRFADGVRAFGPTQADYFKAVNKAMQANGETLKVICSLWSPPAWMKQNDSTTGGRQPVKFKDGNMLRDDMREELAEYLSAYLQLFEKHVGIPLYGLSIQNEPYFSMTYASCVYSPEGYRDTLMAVGRRLKRDQQDVVLFGPEHVRSVDRMRFYLDPILANREAAGYLGAIGHHGYEDDGISENSPTGRQWEAMRSIARAQGKRLWMTETGVGDGRPPGSDAPHDSHAAGFRQGGVLYAALKHGDVSLWTYWCLSDRRDSEHTLMVMDRPTRHYWYIAAFYRYIRPGMKRIDAESDSRDVLSLGFIHPSNGSRTIILVNQAAEPRRATLRLADGKLAGATGFIQYQISHGDEPQAIVEAPVSSIESVALPPRSITALHYRGKSRALVFPSAR